MVQLFVSILLLGLLSVTKAKEYNVGCSFEPAAGAAPCTEKEIKSIHKACTWAVAESGYAGIAKSDNWSLETPDGTTYEGAALAEDDAGIVESMEDGGFNRQLQGCPNYFWCLSTGEGRYCDACYCCGNRRRLKISNQRDLVSAKESIKSKAKDYIAKKVTCVDPESADADVSLVVF